VPESKNRDDLEANAIFLDWNGVDSAGGRTDANLGAEGL
jgi:hypothetical protein